MRITILEGHLLADIFQQTPSRSASARRLMRVARAKKLLLQDFDLNLLDFFSMVLSCTDEFLFTNQPPFAEDYPLEFLIPFNQKMITLRDKHVFHSDEDAAEIWTHFSDSVPIDFFYNNWAAGYRKVQFRLPAKREVLPEALLTKEETKDPNFLVEGSQSAGTSENGHPNMLQLDTSKS